MRFLGEIILPEQAAPTTPPTGYVAEYAKADGKLYQKDDLGAETDLAAAGGSGAVAVKVWDGDSYEADTDVILFVDLTGGNDPKTAPGGRNSAGDIWFDPTPTGFSFPEPPRTYTVAGAITTSSVFPPFIIDESIGTLTMTRITTKLTSGTATLKIRVNGVDSITGINVTSTKATNNFTDVTTLADTDFIDIVCTAASSAVDLTAGIHFTRTL